MSAFTTYAEKKILEDLVGITPWTPGTFHLALFVQDPGETGNVTNEVSGGSYARQPIAWGPVSTGTSTSQVVKNSGNIIFSNMPSTTVRFVGVMESLTGKILMKAPLAIATAVPAGAPFRFDPNNLSMGLE